MTDEMEEKEFERRIVDVLYKAYRDGEIDPSRFSKERRNEFDLLIAIDPMRNGRSE